MNEKLTTKQREWIHDEAWANFEYAEIDGQTRNVITLTQLDVILDTAHAAEDEPVRELTEAEKNYPLTRVFPTCYNCKHVVGFEKFGKQGLKCGLKLFQISTVLVNPFCGDWLQQEDK